MCLACKKTKQRATTSLYLSLNMNRQSADLTQEKNEGSMRDLMCSTRGRDLFVTWAEGSALICPTSSYANHCTSALIYANIGCFLLFPEGHPAYYPVSHDRGQSSHVNLVFFTRMIPTANGANFSALLPNQ